MEIALQRISNPLGNLGELLALVGLPSKRKTTKTAISESARNIIKETGTVLDGLMRRGIAAQSLGEFQQMREDVFPHYASAMVSVARLIKVILPENTIETLSRESLAEFESDFREKGLDRFGTTARDQALSTIWTLRRTGGLLSKIVAAKLPQDNQQKDQEICSNFSFYMNWSQFHLDCLLIAMRTNSTIQLDVLPEIVNGLRGAVNAYGYAREALRLRAIQQEQLQATYQWDEEDEELLNSSMSDLEASMVDD